MSRLSTRLLFAVTAAYALRFVLMATLPLADTTEPRYAEIARLMAVSGDWITPWFEPGVPFWGKPPLSFWAQALSFRILDVSAFAGRLPAWIAIAVTTALVARVQHDRQPVFAAAVFATMALPFISAGTIMTDAFLVLGTTLATVGALLRLRGEHPVWGWAFFLGLAIGLLAKGPLTLVLVGIPLLGWLAVSHERSVLWQRLPWIGGSMLTAILVLPWYLLAELKTPGFLDYFLIGEHFKRFLVSEWQGDLYGSAHDLPRGTIWLHWLMASFPWGVVGLFAGGWHCLKRRTARTGNPALANRGDTASRWLIIGGALGAPVFFTFAGNILWTYVLPSLPFAAILISEQLDLGLSRLALRRLATTLVLVVPVIAGAIGIGFSIQPERLKTEGPLLMRLDARPGFTVGDIAYIDHRPFSARFYSRGQAGLISSPSVRQALQSDPTALPAVLAVRRNRPELIQALAPLMQPIDENLRYVLLAQKKPR